MAFEHVHAFAVVPQRHDDEAPDPVGGRVSVTQELTTLLYESYSGADFQKRTEVAFDVDPDSRTNEMRDLVRGYAFGGDEEADEIATRFAVRLARAMDRRSTPSLLISVTSSSGLSRKVTLWTFPRDSALRLNQRGGEPSIAVLRDVFSRSSGLRKAALFEGRDLRNHFLTGRALDFQANRSTRDVADFWIHRFLGCRFGLEGSAGTRLAAKVFRAAHEACESPAAREQLYGAIVALRVAPVSRVSLKHIADTYLDGEAHEAFIDSIPEPSNAELLFEVRREVFDQTLQFRIFKLESGVVVSSPFGEVGESVRVTEEDVPTLTCQGRVMNEKLRTRHG